VSRLMQVGPLVQVKVGCLRKHLPLTSGVYWKGTVSVMGAQTLHVACVGLSPEPGVFVT